MIKSSFIWSSFFSSAWAIGGNSLNHLTGFCFHFTESLAPDFIKWIADPFEAEMLVIELRLLTLINRKALESLKILFVYFHFILFRIKVLNLSSLHWSFNKKFQLLSSDSTKDAKQIVFLRYFWSWIIRKVWSDFWINLNKLPYFFDRNLSVLRNVRNHNIRYMQHSHTISKERKSR